MYMYIQWLYNNGFADAIDNSNRSQKCVTFLCGFKSLQANVPFRYLYTIVMKCVYAFLTNIPILYLIKTPENVDVFESNFSLIWNNIHILKYIF